MEPVLIYTDAQHADVGAVRSFSLDMAFGADEQDFEVSFAGPRLPGGAFVYIDGTEYGGVVDKVVHLTNSDVVTYGGRTWHGMLAAKVVKPPENSDYYTLSGDANACIRSLISYVGLGSVLTGCTTAAGINVGSFQFPRFCNAYDGLMRMLSSAGAKLCIERHDGIVELWAEPVEVIGDEADSDLMDFEVTRTYRVPNHLVCAGGGELSERIVVDLYADADGNVSQTQTFTGVDEITAYYNYTGASLEDLVEDGTKHLSEYQTKGGADILSVGVGDWRVGDVLKVRDNNSGTVVESTIAKKVVRVEMGVLSVSYEVGDDVAAHAASYEATINNVVEGGGGGGVTDYSELTGKPQINSITLIGNKALSDLGIAAASHTHQYAGSPSVAGNADRTNAILYGTVDGTSTSTAFTATVAGLTQLVDGTAVYLRNGVVTSAAGFTININGLGAKPVYTNLAAATAESTKFNINYTMLFIYNSTRVSGGCWDCYNGYDSNSNTIGYQLRTNSSTLPASDKGYRYRLWFTSADGTKWVPANKSTSTNATASRTPNTTPIDPFGPIVYYGVNGTTNAGDNLTAAYLWTQYTLALGYSFNTTGAALAMTFPAPVYVKCTPQSDGSATLDGYVQALPSSNDGKVYIFLGRAYSATNIELFPEHPVYRHDGTALRLWTNSREYELPTASASTLGGVKVGEHLSITDGVLAVETLTAQQVANLLTDD